MPFLIFLGFIVFVALFHQPTHDDTDPPEGRSGMSLHTDHLTGCQYLGKSGGLTPRLDAEGKHICRKP